MMQPFRRSHAEFARLIQRHIAVFDPWPQTARQLHGANPFAGHLRQHAAVKASVMGDIPLATVVKRDDLFNPRLIRHHRFRNTMYSHRLRTDGTIRAHQMAHWVDYLSVNHVDRSDFHNSTLQITGFGIDNAQH